MVGGAFSSLPLGWRERELGSPFPLGRIFYSGHPAPTRLSHPSAPTQGHVLTGWGQGRRCWCPGNPAPPRSLRASPLSSRLFGAPLAASPTPVPATRAVTFCGGHTRGGTVTQEGCSLKPSGTPRRLGEPLTCAGPQSDLSTYRNHLGGVFNGRAPGPLGAVLGSLPVTLQSAEGGPGSWTLRPVLPGVNILSCGHSVPV